MTAAEADQWAAGTAIDAVQYHVTVKSAVSSLAQDGFILEGTKWARVWGEGVYMTTDSTVVNFYRNAKSYKGAVETIELKVKVSKVLELYADDRTPMPFWKVAAKELGLSEAAVLAESGAINQRIGQTLKAWQAMFNTADALRPAKYQGLKGSALQELMMREEFGRGDADSVDWAWEAVTNEAKKQGYQAIRVKDLTPNSYSVSVGGSQVVVFDPSHVVIVR